MNREQWKERLPLIQAFVDGKTLQGKASDEIWYDLGQDVTFNGPCFIYRIKQEPKLRPWKPEEVPVGSWCRSKYAHEHNHTDFTSIIGVSKNCFYTVEDTIDDMCLQLKNSLDYVYSTDHGKTWLPCGVLE